MKKVLILSYFFSPCAITGANRIKGWADYLHESNIYPIIVTRNWDIPILNQEDVFKSSGTVVRIEKFKNYEVHYVPYQSNLRDKIFQKNNFAFRLFSKGLTVIEILSAICTNYFIPYKNLYTYSKQFIQTNADIKGIITSGKPYELFRFCYLLNKKFNIPWAADYRDPWNTLEPTILKDHMPLRLQKKIDFIEKKWVGSASFFITVSEELKNGIEKFTGTKGYEILNGFEEKDYHSVKAKSINNSKLLIVHNGSLPPVAKTEVFIEAAKLLIEKYKGKIEIECEFLGINFTPWAADKIKKLSAGYEQNFICTDRIPKKDLLQKLSDADCFLMVGHDFKGYPTSKIFEYVALKKPVILSPSDQSSMEEILTNTNQIILGHTIEQTTIELEKIIQKKLNQIPIEADINLEAIASYSRQNQTKKLAELIHKYF